MSQPLSLLSNAHLPGATVSFVGIVAKQAKREPTVAKLAAVGAVGAAVWIVRRLAR